jgi:hypothetical protein
LAKKTEEKQPREYTKRQLSHAKKQQIRQRIYLFGGITVVVAVLVLTLAGWLFGEFLPLNKTIVTVYDTKISETDLIDTLATYAGTQTNFDVEQNMDYIVSAMVQSELIRKSAAELGITISDQEVSDALEGNKVTKAYEKLLRGSLLSDKLRKGHFNDLVADSGNQVLMNTMMVESEEVVPEIRARLLSGDNFTILADEYAQNTVSKTSKGVFDWHPQSIFESNLATTIPTQWAFSEDVNKGDISNALSDNVSSKLLGYWLIRLNESPVTDNGTTANVSALLLSSQAQALRVKAQLEAGESLSSLADTLSQYSPTQTGHGQLKAVQSDNISSVFNDYVFSGSAPLGKWSEPLKDTRYWTKGGAWIVQVVDKSNERPYSTDDKSALVDKVFSDWVSTITTNATNDIKYTFDTPDRTLALDRVNKKLNK